MTLINLPKTHLGCKELFEKNGFSVSRSSVPRSRNAVDITIEEIINRHAKSQGDVIGFSRNYAIYYRWCLTRHLRAQYVEASLQQTEMSYDESSVHKDLRVSQIQNSERDVKRVLEVIAGFTNPSSSDVNPDELYCLSSDVPVKPEVANNLLQASVIGQKSNEDFIKLRLVERSVGFHEPIKRNKLKNLQLAKSQRS